ncbi:hypothetical protein G8C41_05640 [Apibacter sp. B3706]|uniref:hypothetical protein n=1 Tax=Apibacter sp. B3706 TaxID=2656760 RepID=UPI00140DD745|nr:hypothetical protein [Apibacter sp. B3706]QII70325.1 hypothetical protein G8C41_05640 [Apibacter sp. B3706]
MYYYGARYYNPRESVWLSADPLSGYNPNNETEHYIDGQHNGGVYNSFNLNTNIYCYHNPVKLVDPNGKQAYFQGMFNQSAMQAAAMNQQYPQKPMTSDVIKDVLSGVKKDLSNLTENAVSKSLRFTGKVAQDIGDGMSFSDYFLTLTGVGSELGIPLSGAGNAVSTVGGYIEMSSDLLEGKIDQSIKNIAKTIVVETIQNQINKKLDKIPGANKLTKEILKQNVNVKIKGTERLYNYVQDQKSNIKTEEKSKDQ